MVSRSDWHVVLADGFIASVCIAIGRSAPVERRMQTMPISIVNQGEKCSKSKPRISEIDGGKVYASPDQVQA